MAERVKTVSDGFNCKPSPEKCAQCKEAKGGGCGCKNKPKKPEKTEK